MRLINRLRKLFSIVLLVTLTISLLPGAKVYAAEARVVADKNSIYTYNEMCDDINELIEKYSFMKFQKIGSSVEERGLYVMSVGTGSKNILFAAGIHGREYVNPYVVMAMLEDLCVAYEEDESILDGVTVYFLPMINPDGITISQFGKTTTNQKWKSNANGVDLNHNFKCGWGNLDMEKAINKKPNSEGYPGDEALSEPESKAVAKFLSSKSFSAAILYHSTGSVIYGLRNNPRLETKKQRAFVDYVQSVVGYSIVDETKNRENGGMLEHIVSASGKKTLACTLETGTAVTPFGNKYFKTIYNQNKNLVMKVVEYVQDNCGSNNSFSFLDTYEATYADSYVDSDYNSGY